MALVLSLREGQDFFVEDERFIVTKIMSGARFVLQKYQESKLGRTLVKNRVNFDITDQCSSEISDGVFVSAGSGAQFGTVRVAIEAPRELLILRGDKKRVGHAAVAAPVS